RGVGQLLRFVLLRHRRRGDTNEAKHQQRAQHRLPPNAVSHASITASASRPLSVPGGLRAGHNIQLNKGLMAPPSAANLQQNLPFKLYAPLAALRQRAKLLQCAPIASYRAGG